MCSLKFAYLIHPGRGQALPSSRQSSLGDSDQVFERLLAFVTTIPAATPTPPPVRPASEAIGRNEVEEAKGGQSDLLLTTAIPLPRELGRAIPGI